MMARRDRRPGRAAFAVPAALLCIAVLHQAVASPAFEVRSAARVLERLLPQHAAQFDLRAVEVSNGQELCRISAADGHIRIEASTPSALLFGVNWYLKYVAHVQISTNGDQLGSVGAFPLPEAAIELQTPYAYRYALNENVDGYTTPYWDWSRW